MLATKKHQNPALLILCGWGESTCGFPSQRISNAKSVLTAWRHHRRRDRIIRTRLFIDHKSFLLTAKIFFSLFQLLPLFSKFLRFTVVWLLTQRLDCCSGTAVGRVLLWWRWRWQARYGGGWCVWWWGICGKNRWWCRSCGRLWRGELKIQIQIKFKLFVGTAKHGTGLTNHKKMRRVDRDTVGTSYHNTNLDGMS